MWCRYGFSVQAGDGENILTWEESGVCYDYVIDQIPFNTAGTNVSAGDNWTVSGLQGDDVAYKLNVSETSTFDIYTCDAC